MRIDSEKTAKVRVSFPQFNAVVEVDKGSTVLEVAQRVGIGIRSVCGGKGFCGKCKVLVKGGIEHKLIDKTLIPEDELSKGYVLACLAKVVNDAEVFIPPESQFKKAKLLSQVNLPKITSEPILTKVEVSDYIDLVKLSLFYKVSEYITEKAEENLNKFGKTYIVVNQLSNNVIDVSENGVLYGVAVDIGTTKIVAALVNISSGDILAIESEFNKQMMYGEDIVSRISHALDRNGLKELQRSVVETVNILIDRLCKKIGINSSNVYQISVAGNTAMTYLFVALDPYPLIRTFREPVKIDPKPLMLRASDLSLNANKNAIVYVLPCSGRFLGGDVVGDIITAELHTQSEPALLIDIGTNTEVVIGCKNWFIGTTAPAGPAFEGWGLKCGVRAIEGAIESIEIDPKTLRARYKVIGDVKPIGICGSGYIDAVSQLFINGVIDSRGKFYRDIESPHVRKGAEGYEYVVAYAEETATGRDIVVTEKDVYNIVDSKSSVCAAISILMKKMMIDVNKVKRVYICGAFGRYLNIDSAVAIGMIPEFKNAEIIYLGNGSLGGAILTLLSRTCMRNAENVARNIATIELMADPNFMEEYEVGFILPGKPELFPTWWRKSKEIKPWKPSNS
ncbi:MAG: ASKHA domain-containing protein [Ignisphaera sp.]